MLAKLIGSLLIALGGAAVAFAVCRYERRRLQVLDAFISLIFYIKGQVDCYSLPIGSILEGAPRELLSICGRGEGADELPSLVHSSRLYLDEESYRLLSAFASEFGGAYREEQLRRCEYYIGALDEQRRRIYDEVPVRSKIGSALSICSAVGILILLW